MAKQALSQSFLLPLLLFFLVTSGEVLKLANGQENTRCVAKPSSSDAELAANIQFACDQVQVQGGCKIIQEGGPCYLPNTAINHASVAMNLYYQFMGRNSWNCDFRGSGVITISDPSYGSCQYA